MLGGQPGMPVWIRHLPRFDWLDSGIVCDAFTHFLLWIDSAAAAEYRLRSVNPANGHTDRDRFTHPQPYANTHCYRHCDSHRDSDTDTHGNSYTECDAFADRDTHAQPHAAA
jgi:hypothetical protein